MEKTRSGKEKFAIGFMVVWIVFWAAGMLIVIYGLVRSLLSGNLTAAGFMGIWLVAAGFGLAMGMRKLVELLRNGRTAPEGARNHDWNDGTDV